MNLINLSRKGTQTTNHPTEVNQKKTKKRKLLKIFLVKKKEA